MTLTADLAGHDAAYLALAARASEPYDAFVYADLAQAAQVHAALHAADAGDAARSFGRLWLDGTTALGMIACVPGRALTRTRIRAALALRKAGLLADPAAVRRTQLAGQALARPDDDAYYLARIAVDERGRGRGLGAALVAAFEAEARNAGARSLVLEVSPAHAAAIRLYQRAGFTIVDTRQAHDEPSQRTLIYHHMAKTLDGGRR